MKSIFKLSLAILLTVSLFSCSKNSDVQEEMTMQTRKITIPGDKQIEIEILEEINTYRISKGLSAFGKLNIIKSQTYSHTNHMVASEAISHENFNSRSAFLKEQASAMKVGENVAAGFTDAKSLVEGWLNSESHKRTKSVMYY